jgi:NAD(P)-dependent dehydrogenase (short-subunit alcohol dehydrogenase family)
MVSIIPDIGKKIHTDIKWNVPAMNVFENRFKNTIVVITGAGNGIGRTCALRFASEGAVCLICDVNDKDLEETAGIIQRSHGRAECHVFDITEAAQTTDNVNRMIARYKQIHVLVHSVGIGYEKRFVDMSEKEWLNCINVNLNGVVMMTQPIVKNMIENRAGKIVNITSQAGKVGRTLHTHYSASKFGLNGFTQALAQEVARFGVNVNAVCPSRIETKMITALIEERAKRDHVNVQKAREEYIGGIPIGRMGTPEDVAALVAILASDEAGYITGECISISGGR